MRTVNMAHGSLFLLAAYIAIEVQQRMVGKTRNIAPEDVDMLSWIVPLLVGVGDRRGRRVRDLRGVPALEPGSGTAPGADHAGHLGDPRRPDARPRRRPGPDDGRGPAPSPTSSRSSASATPPAGCSCSASPSSSASLLWLWLNSTRMGIVIRAGVADQPMVRALGINIAVVFAITFFVGAFLAGMGGVMVASFAGVATGAGRPVAAALARRRDHRRARLDQGGAWPARCCTAWSSPSLRRTCRATTPTTRSSSPSCCWPWCWRCARTACSGGRGR